jgi:hypothetical protein
MSPTSCPFSSRAFRDARLDGQTLSWQSPKLSPLYGVSSSSVCCAYPRSCLRTAQAQSPGLGRSWEWWLYWRWWIGRSEVIGNTILLTRTRIKASLPYAKGGSVQYLCCSSCRQAVRKPEPRISEAPDILDHNRHTTRDFIRTQLGV